MELPWKWPFDKSVGQFFDSYQRINSRSLLQALKASAHRDPHDPTVYFLKHIDIDIDISHVFHIKC